MRIASRMVTLAAAVAVAGSIAGIVAAQSAPASAKGPVASFVAAVAQNLGVTPARLQSAFQAAELARVQSLSQSGKISAVRAKALTAFIDRSPLAALSRGPNGPARIAAPARRAELKAAAAYLGLSRATLRKDRKAGQSLAAIAQAQAKTATGLVAAMLVPLRSRLDKAVAAGHLTVTQEQAMLSHARVALGVRVAKA